MKPLSPIFLADLLPKIDKKLIEILHNLSHKDWLKQSLALQWQVKDIVAHLLDGNLRTLSMLRDGFYGESPEDPSNHQGMVDFLNQLNADWVKAMRRLSPRVLIELLELSGKQYCEYIKSLDPFAKSPFSVEWAGEEESLNWFHIAREYTEKWHHQQQIRFAVGQEAELYQEQWYFPYLDTSMRALPYHYRDVKSEKGVGIQFVVGDTGNWFLYSSGVSWQLVTELPGSPVSLIKIPNEIAWRIFTKGISREEALQKSEITGDINLGNEIFDMIAVMA